LRAVDVVAAQHGIAPISPLLLDRAGSTLDQLLIENPTRAHLAIFATNLAWYAQLTSINMPDVLLGHSLGEIAALTAAGAYTIEQGTVVVIQRDLALASIDHPPDGGLLRVGVSADQANSLLTLTESFGSVVAVRNAARETVISGPAKEISTIRAAAAALGLPHTTLSAAFPFHNPMLSTAAIAFADSIATILPAVPRIKVYSPILGRYYAIDDDVNVLVASHLVKPVNFHAAITTLYAAGIDDFVESGARRTLTNLVELTIPTASVQVPTPRPALATTSTPTPAPTTRKSDLVEMLRVEYAKALDYPIEVVEAEVDLESELGVDSMKHTEIFLAVLDKLQVPNPGTVRIASYPTLTHVADLLLSLV
jgi:acyl transferase domain-containing protein